MSKEEPRCVVCGKKVRGNSFKMYGNPAKEIKFYICSEHKDYIKVLDSLELPSTENIH
jgi:DNA-directed RNA polymerase subunit N (RpoN/RPB10)